MWLKLCKSVLARITWALAWNGILSRRVRISSAVLSVWEYRISNPQELVAVSVYLALQWDMCTFYSCYVQSFQSQFWRSFQNRGNKIFIMYTRYRFRLWVIQLISQYWRLFQTENFILIKQNYVLGSLIPSFGIRRQPVKVQLLLLTLKQRDVIKRG